MNNAKITIKKLRVKQDVLGLKNYTWKIDIIVCLMLKSQEIVWSLPNFIDQ